MWKDGVDDRGNMWLRRRKGGRGPETWVWESLATGLQGVSVTVTRHGKLSALRCLHWGQLMQRHKCQIGLWVLHQEVRIIRGIVAEEFSIRVTFERSPCAFMIKVLQGNRTNTLYIWRVIGSCAYGGPEGPPTVCHLQAGDPGVGSVIQSKAEAWELGRSVELMMWIPIWVSKSENQEHWSPGAEMVSQLQQSTPLHFGPSVNWTLPIYTGQGDLLCSVAWLKC